MKERWFNYRPLLIVFLFLLLGSLFAFYITSEPLVCSIATIILFVVLTIIAILTKKIHYLLVPIISLLVGVAAYYVAVSPFKNNQFENKSPDIVQARVFYRDKANDSYMRVYADSCTIDGTDQNYNIIVYIYDNDDLYQDIEIGSVISFQVINCYLNDLFDQDTPNSTLYTKDLRYTISCSMDSVRVLEIDKTFAEKIKDRVYNNLNNGLSNENVELAYSSLFGDKAMLGERQQDAIKLSGVAHLLAVSGLHVGIIVKLLTLATKKIANRKWLRLFIIASFLLFYAYICGFSASVVRASIMSAILLMAPIFFRRYDTMSAISLAGIICFLINPLSVYDVSFLMSYSCVMGITILYKPIREGMLKIKSPKWLADSVSISTATMIALVVIMAYFFNNFNFISIVANLVIIPIFTACFTIFFVLSFVSLLFPFVTYLLYIINPILDFIVQIAGLIGYLPISNIATMDINYISIVLYFLFLLFAGRFCVAKRESKFLITVPMIALLVVGMMI